MLGGGRCVSNERPSKHLSAIDIISCCNDCGYGCSGGQALKAWNYAIREGVPTGGRYGTEGVCKPYYFHPCGRHANQTYYGECPLAHRTPQCFKACHPYYPVGYNEDKIFGKTAYQLPNDEKAIMREIMTNGPVAASMRLHADFAFYRRGVYINTGGRDRGGHAVKIIGWGTENGTPYWLIANSYNFDWGEKGYFRMIRGKNNCKIEEKVVAGTMNVEKYL
ncbi:hypothetical protein Y032_0119g813 [Ancylostoma ceylanicum]|uniref:Peptidase C1A papain C-terminal domain-containing protein n=1 Tax=Ancylostoma ceylanicum TaxID=53326 RepID=A0A016TB29_9BILA|nr:hypothetical protein Y032_0119g813 [Ancylostoma ceylanicum]